MPMHMMVDASTPVGPIARHYPAAIDIFELLDIDYACFGGRTVTDAAIECGADPEEVLSEVLAITNIEPEPEPSLPDLVHRIITEHHRMDRELMRDLSHRLSSRAHPDGNISRIRRLLVSLGTALGPHARREERELFPLVEELALHPERIRAGTISRRLFAEFIEHGTIHERLRKIREITLRLRAARFGDRGLLDDLDSFERMAHRHIHMENNVLIPRVVETENRLRAERALEQAPVPM
ncbi:MAG TPA: DUF542 domain-containing protein [Thermoanaerobaculia bacterium]|nr:DUF542 domain-containing protein [Thermoanaerobaculia bacterium]